MPNRWGQDWAALVTVEGIDLDSRLAEHTADWIVHGAESFYVSLGFDPLPPSFYERSSLYHRLSSSSAPDVVVRVVVAVALLAVLALVAVVRVVVVALLAVRRLASSRPAVRRSRVRGAARVIDAEFGTDKQHLSEIDTHMALYVEKGGDPQ